MVEYSLHQSQDLIKKNIRKKKYKKLGIGLLYTSPVILGYLIFVFIPLIIVIILSMTDFSLGADKTTFLGLQNYINMFSGQDIYFWPSIKATFYYVLGSVPLNIIFAFIIACLLNTKIKGRTLFRGIFYLPVVIPLAG